MGEPLSIPSSHSSELTRTSSRVLRNDTAVESSAVGEKRDKGRSCCTISISISTSTSTCYRHRSLHLFPLLWVTLVGGVVGLILLAGLVPSSWLLPSNDLLLIAASDCSSPRPSPSSPQSSPFATSAAPVLSTTDLQYLDDLIAATKAALAASSPVGGYTLTLCAVIKAEFEMDFVLEWLMYHALLGFQHVQLAENVDKPGEDNAGPPFIMNTSTLAPSPLQVLLAPLIESQFISFHTIAGEHYTSQSLQVTGCWRQHDQPRPAKWVSDFDIDEFLVHLPSLARSPSVWLSHARSNHFPLHEQLESYLRQNESVVYMDRMDFSAWPHRHFIPADALVLDSFVYSIPKLWDAGFFPKTIGVAEHVDPIVSNGHTAKRNASHWAYEVYHATTPCHTRWPGDAPFDGPFPPGIQCYEPMRIHHYISRSFADCMTKLHHKTDVNAKANKVITQNYWRVSNGVAACRAYFNESPIVYHDIFSTTHKDTHTSITIIDAVRRMRQQFLAGQLVL